MMGAKRVKLLVVFLFCFCNPAASLHPLSSHTLPMVRMQANTGYKGEEGRLNNAKKDENIIPSHGRKLEHAIGSRGVTGGGSDSNGGGGTHSGNPRGGAAVIPIYAAGAGHGHRNNHHGAGSCIHLSIGTSTLAAALSAYLLLKNPF